MTTVLSMAKAPVASSNDEDSAYSCHTDSGIGKSESTMVTITARHMPHMLNGMYAIAGRGFADISVSISFLRTAKNTISTTSVSTFAASAITVALPITEL